MKPESPVESVEQGKACSRRMAHSGQRGSDASNLPASTLCISIIPELQWKIFQLVHAAPENYSRKKTLLALALTCKSFTGPALKLLWRNLSGFAPLIKCLPQSLWKQVGRKLEFQRVMTVDDWSIFCKYNHHVRSLVIRDHSPVGDEIWRTLSCPPFSLPLLPNLMSLTWSSASIETFLSIPLFVSPTITRLNLISCTFGAVEHSILSCISMMCPLVSQFSFCPNTKSNDTSTALQNWSHLTSVTTGTVSEAAILHLSKLPSLRFLHFGLPSTPISVDTQKLQHPVFCALEELIVNSSSLVLLDAFLERFSIGPKSINLTITGGLDSTIGVLPTLISRLSNACAHDSLKFVRFCINHQFIDHITAIRIAVLRPLLAFRNLRRLDFTAYDYNLRWDDAILLQMAKAWPLLQVLNLNQGQHSSRGVTPSAFISLLQHCPCLVSVAVIVNWSTIDGHDISPDAPYGGFAHKALSTALFGSPRIHHPGRIAAFISAIAPNLASIITWTDGDREEEDIDSNKYSTRWKCVRDLIKTFSAVREQGRRMVLSGGAGADGNQGPHNHYGTAQLAHETENGDAVIGGGDKGDDGDVFEVGGGIDDESDYMTDESS
ncbi:hypothetical protein DEU56DRAFT_789738 [Suillus clintonianus]|uniref:uncharacterized protein n=1 Tax=Suillus clintonianus TaxID=1904413 RepID=UPI001B86A446|nr:uncharacterized protein DEU56DRAFT_789738 [Suillus clintonianus]KAG2144471.1 hypothetical protein DEU56DRAFT_789738 [Suillus clintonianus]